MHNTELRQQIESLRASGKELEASRVFFEHIPASDRPMFAASILRLFVRTFGFTTEPISEVLRTAENPLLWRKGHDVFDNARVAWLALNESPKRTGLFRKNKNEARSKRSEEEMTLLALAESVAKVTYNATNPLDEFDEDSGWYLGAWLWRGMRIHANDLTFVDAAKSIIDTYLQASPDNKIDGPVSSEDPNKKEKPKQPQRSTSLARSSHLVRVPTANPLIMVFIPMQIEHAAIRRALDAAGHPDVRTIQTGIGKHALLKALQTHAPTDGSRPLMILAGAAGGLVHLENHIPPIARVIDEHGHSWTPHRADPAGVTLIAVDTIISTPADKKALAASTGASVVDMEAHAFAAFCEERGLPWTVVRGVSDTPDETLPAQVINWITPEGNTRNLRAARDLALRPWLIPHIVSVVRRSNRVLPLVGTAVVEAVRRS